MRMSDWSSGVCSSDLQYSYETPNDARLCFEKLRTDGFGVILGSRIVVEMAEAQGLVGLLSYSANSVRRGFDDAIELARVTRLELGRYQQLNGVLGTLREAVLACGGRHHRTVINPMREERCGTEIRPLQDRS